MGKSSKATVGTAPVNSFLKKSEKKFREPGTTNKGRFYD
jgi:hypothetical protein